MKNYKVTVLKGDGIGVSHNISYASMKGIVCAINRDQADTMRDDTMPGIFDVC